MRTTSPWVLRPPHLSRSAREEATATGSEVRLSAPPETTKKRGALTAGLGATGTWGWASPRGGGMWGRTARAATVERKGFGLKGTLFGVRGPPAPRSRVSRGVAVKSFPRVIHPQWRHLRAPKTSFSLNVGREPRRAQGAPARQVTRARAARTFAPPPSPPPWSLFCGYFPSVFTSSLILGGCAFSYRITKRCGSCRPLNIPSEETRGGATKSSVISTRVPLFYYILFYLKSILCKTVLCQGASDSLASQGLK